MPPQLAETSQLTNKQDTCHNSRNIDMSDFDSEFSWGFRSLVSGSAALVITGLIVWAFYGYAGYLERNVPSTPMRVAQIESGTSTSDLDSRTG